MILVPQDWKTFQHYKDRCPPWIKFHRDLLNNRTYACLPIASKALAPLLWLLASESENGHFNGSVDELVFRLHMTEKDVKAGLKPLIDKGFFIVASKMLADGYQVAIPETETETETEVERETERKKKSKAPFSISVEKPESVSDRIWEEFVSHRRRKDAKITALVMEEINEQAALAGWPLENALKELIVRNWQTFKADWVKDKNNNSGGSGLSKQGEINQRVTAGLTRGLIGGNNVKLLGR
jgi:hypothetical protein